MVTSLLLSLCCTHAHTHRKLHLPFKPRRFPALPCSGLCRRERKRGGGGWKGDGVSRYLFICAPSSHSDLPETEAICLENVGRVGFRVRACPSWAFPLIPRCLHPPPSCKMVCLWNCQLAKPQVRNKDHLCTVAPEVTSSAPVNSTMTKLGARDHRITTPYPHYSPLPNRETFPRHARNNETKGRATTEARCLGGFREGKAKC